MSTLVTNYPVFSPSQVLTNTHLNSIRDFLDSNIRFDRSELNGVGIIGGLGASLDTTNPTDFRLTVADGIGLTADGYIIQQSSTVYNKAVNYTDPSGYTPWSSAVAGDIKELIPVGGISGDPLSSLDLSDKVIVAFIEISDTDQESCLAVENTFGGINRALALKLLLVKKSLLVSFNNESILSVLDPASTIKLISFQKAVSNALSGENIWDIADYTDIQNAYTNSISDAQVKLGTGILNAYNAYHAYLGLQFNELSYQMSNLDLATNNFIIAGFDLTALISIGSTIIVTNSSANNGAYTVTGVNYTGDTSITVSQTIPSSVVGGNIIFDLDFQDFLANALTNKNLVSGNENYIQYVEAYLEDLLQTYNEFAAVAYNVKQYTVADLTNYSRHLMIGTTISSGQIDNYRNYFIQSSDVSGKDISILKAQLLFEKLVTMIRSFSIPEVTVTPVLLTPSVHKKEALSKAALPFYYDLQSNNNQFAGLIQLWNPDLKIKGKGTDVQSYHLNNGNSITKPTGVTIPDYVANPYSYETNEYNFIRIEGLLQKNISVVIPQLIALAQNQNVRFNVASVELNAVVTPPVPPNNFDFGNFRHFAYKYPGMSHQGGVPTGGTFVVVHDNTGTIVADFAIDLEVIQ